MPGIEPTASCILGKFSTYWAISQSGFTVSDGRGRPMTKSILTGKFYGIQISLSRRVSLENSHVRSCPRGVEGLCALYRQSLVLTRDSSWNSKYWLCPFSQFVNPSSWYSSPRSTLTGLTVPWGACCWLTVWGLWRMGGFYVTWALSGIKKGRKEEKGEGSRVERTREGFSSLTSRKDGAGALLSLVVLRMRASILVMFFY